MCLFGKKRLKEVIREKKKHNNTDALAAEIAKNSRAIKDPEGNIIGLKTSGEGKGYVSEENGLNILNLTGNQMEMAFQHGYLLAEQIQQPRGNPPVNIFKYWSNYVDGLIDGFAPGLGTIVKAITAPWSEEASLADRIPNDVFRSLVGIKAGYSKRINELKKQGTIVKDEDLVTLMDWVRGYIQPDICNLLLNNTVGGGSIAGLIIRDDGLYWPDEPLGQLGCSSVAITGGKTKNKDLLLGCDFDYDPLAGLWEKNLTLIHFNPLPENEGDEKPQKYLTVTTAGSHTTGLLGVNENGVAFRVHNNFTGTVDKRFNWKIFKHGQPLLNFGDYILRHAKDVETEDKLENVIKKIKKGITCEGRISDSPPSGWSFIVAQHKNSEKGSVIVRETNFKNHKSTRIPMSMTWSGWRKKNRFALLSDVPEIKNGADIESIWQSNFYTYPKFRKKDIFMRKSSQLDNINRFFRLGGQVREIYESGDIEWTDVAEILSDNKNVFTGKKERLNVGTVASLVTVSSIIFSIKPVHGELPEINVYVAGQKQKTKRKTPTCWWPYHHFKLSAVESIPDDTLMDRMSLTTAKPSPVYKNAYDKFYDAFTYYTYTKPDNLDYAHLQDLLEKTEKVFISAKSTAKMDPFLHFLIGRVLCNRIKKFSKNAQETLVQQYIKQATGRFEKCINSKYLYDPHLLTLAKVFYVRLGFNSNNQTIKNKTAAYLEELEKEQLYFDEFELTATTSLAVSPFLKKLALNRGDKLSYLRDERLEEVIEELVDDREFDLEDLEESLNFDGPDPLFYDYQVII